MRLFRYFSLTFSWIFAVAGCGSGGDFPVEPTTGVVMCDGQPVPHVTVFFEPLASGETALAGKQGIGIADENGKFPVSTYAERDGAVLGRHRVRVGRPTGDSHPDFSCPCQLNPERDVMQVEVKRDGPNDFQVIVNKKSATEKPSLEELEAREEAREDAKEREMAQR